MGKTKKNKILSLQYIRYKRLDGLPKICKQIYQLFNVYPIRFYVNKNDILCSE